MSLNHKATGSLNGRNEENYTDAQALDRLARELEILANARVSPGLRDLAQQIAEAAGLGTTVQRIEQQQVRRARMEGRDWSAWSAIELRAVKGQGRTTPRRPPILSVVERTEQRQPSPEEARREFARRMAALAGEGAEAEWATPPERDGWSTMARQCRLVGGLPRPRPAPR
ncbi:MAG: hypothetical protein M0P31_16975 [Solirubrobacteraceae bacterium]|nr:hypothetical protein [Solirubrobacteraceae bacterium]